MTTNIFVAYADLYIGAQLCHEFARRPHAYTVYGCTWSEKQATDLAGGQPRSHSSRPSLSPRDGRNDNSSTQSFSVTQASVAQSRAYDYKAMLHKDAHVHTGTLKEHTGFLATAATMSARVPANVVMHACNGNSPMPIVENSRVHYFWRRDVSALHRALHMCELIVVVMREAQDVFDILACVQREATLQRKRFVLVSNFMTWYSTPPLLMSDKANNARDTAALPATGVFAHRDDSTRIDDSKCPSHLALVDDDDGDVAGRGANSVLELASLSSDTSSDNATDVDDAYDMDVGANANAATLANSSKKKNDDNDADDNDDGEAERLTDDQYNRRVPHVQYYNWRDAERAVARAHHAEGLPLDTFVVCAGLAYGNGEGLLQSFFKQAWCSSGSGGGGGGGDGCNRCVNVGNNSPHHVGSTVDGDENGDADNYLVAGKRGSTAARARRRAMVLPIFGTGKQRIPMIHVQDLAVFVRKLLRCPLDELPYPSTRYIFATDGGCLSWREVIYAIHGVFGQATRCVPVLPCEELRYRDVEQFTVDLRVSNATTRVVMSRDDNDGTEDAEAGGDMAGDKHYAGAGNDGSGGMSSVRTLLKDSAWVAEDGFTRNIRRVANEFCTAHAVHPLRVAVLGPPFAGKTHLCAQLSAAYDLPTFTITDIVDSYTSHLRKLHERISRYRNRVFAREVRRRVAAKKRHEVLRQLHTCAQVHEMPASHSNAQVVTVADKNTSVVPSAHDVDAVVAATSATMHSNNDMNTGRQQRQPQQQCTQSSAKGATGAADSDVDDDDDDDGGDDAGSEADVSHVCGKLTSDEEAMARSEADAIVQGSHKVKRWHSQAAQMERVLLMRTRPRAATPDANPKRRANTTRKKLTREQQRKKDEDDLAQARAAVKSAPLHDRALALMVRWRLDKADCRNQGYILDGFPTTVKQCRLCFGTDVLAAPQSDEEALHIDTLSETSAAYTHHNGGISNDNNNNHAASTGTTATTTGGVRVTDDVSGGGGRGEGDDNGHALLLPSLPHEICNTSRLPDYVLLLHATEQEIRARFVAASPVTRRAHNVVDSDDEADADHSNHMTLTDDTEQQHHPQKQEELRRWPEKKTAIAVVDTTASMSTTTTNVKATHRTRPLSAAYSPQRTLIVSREASGQSAVSATLTAPSTNSVRCKLDEANNALDHFDEQLRAYNEAFVYDQYTVTSFFQSAVAALNEMTSAKRRVIVHEIDTAPIGGVATTANNSPTSSTAVNLNTATTHSAGELADANKTRRPLWLGELATTAMQILGAPHNFGKNAKQIHDTTAQQVKEHDSKQARAHQSKLHAITKSDSACIAEDAYLKKVCIGASAMRLADVEGLEQRKKHLHAYVAKCVMPILNEGMRNVCDKQPEQPTLYLAQWLQNHNPHHDTFNEI